MHHWNFLDSNAVFSCQTRLWVFLNSRHFFNSNLEIPRENRRSFLRQDAKRTGIEWRWLAARRHANQECSVVPREMAHEPGVYDKPATKAFSGKCDKNVSHSRGVKNKGCTSPCKAALPQDNCAFKEKERFGRFSHFWLFSENNTKRFGVSLSWSLYVGDSRKEMLESLTFKRLKIDMHMQPHTENKVNATIRKW